ncbi:MAG: T9SS type A sorting domain-containing protein, partial [Ignavibacteriales bacterium]|nr:T9SS type A sorting domain-containing protein [Ignavibacteriales bacterium]
SIKLYDITGRLVKRLVNEQKPSGRHKTTIESGNLASGIYIYSLRVNEININKNW